MMIRISIVDDKLVNRQSFISKIQSFDNVELIIVAESGDDFLEQMKSMPAKKIPQIAFIDLEMPGLDGIQTISITKALYPEIHCLVLTVFDDEEKIFEAIRAGANGYLLKDENKSFIYEAMVNVLDYGGAPMSPAIARKTFKLLNRVNDISSESNRKNDHPEENILSEREKEILNYTINGWDAKRIATSLEISVHTVRKHIANIYDKLHVTSKAQIIQLAYKNNWLKS